MKLRPCAFNRRLATGLYRSALAFAMSGSALGCAAAKPLPQQPALAEASADNLPFKLEISQEQNDGKTIDVLGRVTALTHWNPEAVELRIIALKQGEKIATGARPLSDFVHLSDPAYKVINPGQAIPFRMSLDAPGLTDYQIEVRWGQQRHAGQGAARATAELRDVEVEPVPSECAASECPRRFRLIAFVVNSGDVPLSKLSLGVSYVWQSASGTEQADAPKSQEVKVDVPNLQLNPKQELEIRLLLDREVPAPTEQGGFYPKFRIVSAE